METSSTAYILVGAPGSGKSTVAAGLKSKNTVVICGDEIRKELYGNADTQGVWTDIHDRIVEILEENVGKTVVMDGTHYNARYRKETLALLQSYGYTDVQAVVVNPPLDVCLARNAARSRIVPRHVIVRMHQTLQESVKGIDTEGFTVVKYVDNWSKTDG